MLFVHVSGGLVVWIGVGCPCPPVRNDIVTPRHLFGQRYFLLVILFDRLLWPLVLINSIKSNDIYPRPSVISEHGLDEELVADDVNFRSLSS